MTCISMHMRTTDVVICMDMLTSLWNAPNTDSMVEFIHRRMAPECKLTWHVKQQPTPLEFNNRSEIIGGFTLWSALVDRLGTVIDSITISNSGNDGVIIMCTIEQIISGIKYRIKSSQQFMVEENQITSMVFKVLEREEV